MDHPNVVKLHSVYEEKTKFYMVMELMTGGEVINIQNYTNALAI